MDSTFIRHKFTDLPDFANELWTLREIAIHYENIPSTKPEDYTTNAGKNAMRRLNNYCEEGVIMGAKYGKNHSSKILIGEISKGSDINIRTVYKEGKPLHYKCVKLKNVKEVTLAEYPLLAAIQPRGGAITGWPSAARVLKSIYSGESIEPDVMLLSPGQLEVLCQEYLRKEGTINALLLPIGRNLLDIDIVGIKGSTHKVFAQVTQETHQSRVVSKLAILEQYRGLNNELIFFGPKSCKKSTEFIRYITIESVFDNMRSSQEVIYHRIIAEMFNT